MYRRKIHLFYIAAFMLLSILLSGCETDESTIAQTTETIQMPEAVYEFPVMVSENRELTICLHLAELADFSAKEIREIQVCDGDQLLQTITKDGIPEVTDYAWDGLFLNESNTVGLPDVRDLNFDGSEDFGLLAVFAYPQNVPYSYFFWNAEKELFEYQFTALGPGWLQIDATRKCLIEVSREGAQSYEKLFLLDQNGNVVSEDLSNAPFAEIEDIHSPDEKMMMQILQNQTQFYSESNEKSMTLEEYCTDESERLGFTVSITQYTFVDMDGDGIQEAIVDFCFGENNQVMCMVLKWDQSSETVYGIEFYHRQMSQIKEDGSFVYSGGGDNDGWAKLRWENHSWAKEPIEDSSHKTDIPWYIYPIQFGIS